MKDLTEDEKKQILISEDFQSFFSRTTRIVERVLAENDDDVYVDYAGGDNEGKDEWVSFGGGGYLMKRWENYENRIFFFFPFNV